MKIALAHYHLRSGGVTSVVLHQARALRDAGDEVLIITGEKPPEDPGIPLVLIEGLQYDQIRNPLPQDSTDFSDSAANLAGAISAAMESHWGSPADILHVHNPLIRKNRSLIPALKLLQKRGIRLLLQNHDLAEDFRPDVYTGEAYPENCHYGVINSRDYSFLHRAGLKTAGLHLIPNEVFPMEAAGGLERTRYLYPVRGIRRKNIGEALFFSLFIPKGRTVALTLPPTTERDLGVYRRWIALAQALRLPVEFEVGMKKSFSETLGSSLCVITTSIKEGFGFSFLEPWTAGRAVLGRRLDVCRDFEDAGVVFDSLYNSINIPTVYISPGQFYKKMEQTLAAVFHTFGLAIPDYLIGRMGEEFLNRETLDFGSMDEEFQENIIRTLISNSVVREEIIAANPFLAALPDWKPDEDLIETNRRVILEKYSRERILEILRDTYRQVLGTPVSHKIQKTLLLELYLDPLRFSLVGVSRD
ncbi:hypothetical protein FACS189468_7050 [Spirochaetia bacterium]|nr:hypothetical protein FACS189468_7050 [Spirochaetia bacterium]